MDVRKDIDLRKEVWLCLSGGNALGAYHAGAYAALHEAGIRPTRIAGASIGGIIGAIIAGNPPETRVDKLAQFWQRATEKSLLPPSWSDGPGSKIASALATLVHGRPGLFHPAFSQWWKRMVGLSSPSLFDRTPLRSTLPDFIDFDRLNGGEIRLVVNAVDVETGEDVVFDTAETRITVDHLMATTAFPVLYAPEEVEGRKLVDGGVSANLPLPALFRAPPAGPVACLAFDLVSPRGTAPASLDDALNRTQDLVLAKQSAHLLDLVRLDFLDRMASARSGSQDAEGSVALLQVAYDGGGEVGAKTLEFSRASMANRRQAGCRDGALALAWLRGLGSLAPGSFEVEWLVRSSSSEPIDAAPASRTA